MLARKRKLRKKVRSLSSRFLYFILGILFLAIVGFLVDANWKINKKRGDLSAQISHLQEQAAELENLKEQYEQGLLKAEKDEFWEARLREEGYQKPGEGVFVVVPTEEEVGGQPEEEKTFWQRLRERLGF